MDAWEGKELLAPAIRSGFTVARPWDWSLSLAVQNRGSVDALPRFAFGDRGGAPLAQWESIATGSHGGLHGQTLGGFDPDIDVDALALGLSVGMEPCEARAAAAQV